MRSPMKRGFTLIELLVVIAIIAILASILFPVFAKAREKARQTQCTSNVKQLALAIQMYSQDNGSQYPGNDGSGWVSKIAPYLGSSSGMFQCPSDGQGDNVVSYAMAGLLIRKDGSGVKESQVISPSEVGALCDATPSQPYPTSRLIGGGAQQAVENNSAEPDTRHSKGLIVGFVDGHAKYFQGAIDKANEGHGAVRALYHAAPLGLIDNPLAGIPNNCSIAGSGTLIVGGEYATRPFLMGAAQQYGNFYTSGFKGQKYTTGRPGSGWLWGTANQIPPQFTNTDFAQTAIAYDGVCVIVAKGCKIPGAQGVGAWPSMVNQTYAVNTVMIKALFETGYLQNTVQVYHLPDAYASTNVYIRNVIGNLGPNPWGIDSIEVANDAEMIEKVGNDPYGIGYCSTALADPDRVVIVAPVIAGTTYVWPRSSTKFRWVMPTMGESTWPWKRSLDVTNAVGETSTAVLNARTALRTGNFIKVGLYAGPLFTWGYWQGNY